jgi:hypothetical protein
MDPIHRAVLLRGGQLPLQNNKCSKKKLNLRRLSINLSQLVPEPLKSPIKVTNSLFRSKSHSTKNELHNI